MTRPRMRPTFALVTEVAPETVFERMRERLSRGECPVSGLVGRRQAELTTCAARRHFWSPVMVVEFDEATRDGLRGRFAPHPSVWTGFMAVYGVLGMVALGACMFGFSQWRLGWTPWALVAVPVAGLLAALAYGAAFIGQGLGAEEMYELRAFLDRCVDDTPDRKSERPPAALPGRTATATRTSGVRFD